MWSGELHGPQFAAGRDAELAEDVAQASIVCGLRNSWAPISLEVAPVVTGLTRGGAHRAEHAGGGPHP
jgi:hypothetical protein